MDKTQKAARIAHYENVVKPDGYCILAEFAGIPVGAMEQFRVELKVVGGTVLILKNTLAKIVFERKGLEEVCEYLIGTSILFYGDEDIAPAAKLLAKLIQRFPELKIKTIVYESSVFAKEEFKAFTSMPTKNEVRAKLLSVIKAPQANFVHVINSGQRVVCVINAFADKQVG